MNTKPERLLSLFLIRHGQTGHNISDNPVTEQTIEAQHNPPLTETGRKQAEALGKFYSDTDFDYIFCSGLSRALDTAEALRAGQTKEKELLLKPDLAEVNIPEDFSGIDFAELKKDYPFLTLADGYSENKTVISDGGDIKKIFERAGSIITSFCEAYSGGEKIAVVAHAGIITYMILYLLEFRDRCPAIDFEINNTGVTEVTFYKHGTFRDDVVIEYVNSTRHLPDDLRIAAKR